jgi:predicted cupin superfamily sugar epimerase
MNSAKYWIEKLDLTKHPEGGYFKEVYRSDEYMPKTALPARYRAKRNFATSIYFLLEGKEFSSFHRIQSDETWHFYVGSTLELYVLNADGSLTTYLLGRNLEKGESLQVTIPQNHWFGARVVDATGFALLGCTVAPGFHFDDFELAERSKLLK